MRARGEDAVAGEVTFGPVHEGAPGFAHGGAVAAALDDALGMLLVRLRRPAVTRRLEVDYLRPAFLKRRYELVAACESVQGRKLWLTAELREGDHVVASARALFVCVEPEHFLQSEQGGDLAARIRAGEQSLPW